MVVSNIHPGRSAQVQYGACGASSSDISVDILWGSSWGFDSQDLQSPGLTPAQSWIHASRHYHAETVVQAQFLCCVQYSLSSKTSLYLATFILLSILTILPIPASEKYLNTMTRSPPSPWEYVLIADLILWYIYNQLSSGQKSSIFVSPNQRILFLLFSMICMHFTSIFH